MCLRPFRAQERMAATLLKTQPGMLPVIARKFAAKKVQATSFKDKQRLFIDDRRGRKQVQRLPPPPPK